MSSSGTRKNSPSHRVTGESSPVSPSVQPRPLPMLGALYRGEQVRVLAGRAPDVLDYLQPVEHAGLQLVTGKRLEGAVDLRQRRLVRRVVVGVVGERRPRLCAEDVVDELVGVVRVLGAL